MKQKNHNITDYTSYGFVREKRLGTASRSQARKEYDNKTAELCENIKDAGIRVYSITFQVKSKSTEKLFQECASETELYFHSPTNAELESVFQQIAVDLSNLRLSK
jgi:L-rhamnose mutarotase